MGEKGNAAAVVETSRSVGTMVAGAGVATVVDVSETLKDKAIGSAADAAIVAGTDRLHRHRDDDNAQDHDESDEDAGQT